MGRVDFFDIVNNVCHPSDLCHLEKLPVAEGVVYDLVATSLQEYYEFCGVLLACHDFPLMLGQIITCFLLFRAQFLPTTSVLEPGPLRDL